MKKRKSCNLCNHFKGYGLHWFAGGCEHHNGEISFMDYINIAENCEYYETNFVSACEKCKKINECGNYFMSCCSKQELKVE